jgi:hypothetical protein
VLVNIGEGGKPGGEWSNTGGHYEDVYVRTAEGWRINSRNFYRSKSAQTVAAEAAGAAAPPPR